MKYPLALITVCFALTSPAMSEPAAKIAEAEAAGREPDRGWLIVAHAVTGRGREVPQAARLGIWPGDVIVRIDDKEIATEDDFREGLTGNGATSRKIEFVDPTGRRQTEMAKRGQLGVYGVQYEKAYGRPLAKALRALSTGEYGEAVKQFEAAVKAGMPLAPDECLFHLYAESAEYAGKPEKARDILRGMAPVISRHFGVKTPWTGMSAAQLNVRWTLVRDPEDVCDGSLLYFTLDQALKTDLRTPSAASISGVALVGALQRYAEGLPVLASVALDREAAEEQCFGKSTSAWLFDALLVMKQESEARKFVQHAAADGLMQQSSLHRAEMRVGLAELAIKELQVALEINRKRSTESEPMEFAELIRALTSAGRGKEAAAVVRGISKPAEAMSDNGAMSVSLMAWSDTSAAWAEVARAAFAKAPDKPDVLLNAFAVLSRQPKPNIEEVAGVLKKVRELTSNARWSNPLLAKQLSRARADLAILQGEYQSCVEILRGASLPERNAIKFLTEHSQQLKQDNSPCLRAQFAWPQALGGWLLLTQDQRVFWASSDAIDVMELPAPEQGWFLGLALNIFPRPLTGGETFWVSASGSHVVAISGLHNLYLLNKDKKRWTLLARVKERAQVSYMSQFQPVLDDFVASLMKLNEADREIVWPPTVSVGQPSTLDRLMLADGTWMTLDRARTKLSFPAKLLSDASGKATRIYEIIPSGERRDAWFFTDQGIARQTADGKFSFLPLPDRDGPAPVTCLTGGNSPSPGCVRIGVLPHAGHEIYRLDLTKGTLAREHGSNESYPLTYWLQQSAEVNRRQMAESAAKLKVAWPPAWAAE